MTSQIASGPIVVLTGAGISKASGLDTFRDADGIWSKVRIEDVATPQAFARAPERVHAFYNARRQRLLSSDVAPNPAHFALARLEQDWPHEVLVVTQNIDDLHERAGTSRLIHMHGEMLKARCGTCAGITAWKDDLGLDTPCPACRQSGAMRPDVVWFGEIPLEMDRIYQAIAECALFISIGTSGNVTPAAGFVREAREYAHAHTVELNLEPSAGHTMFHEAVLGPAAIEVPAYVDRLLAS
ncbi:MAG: NAD-dependent deacylase [Proteobacteria bacterium]|nr:NAD-dependent deacylase [Pseudomonadota bacterium]